jgi:predicted dehydrogenase
MESVELAAVCDIDASRGEAAAGQYGCAFFDDYRSLADAADAVVIAVPTNLHREVGTFFLERGVACLIEKPLAGSVEDADALAEAAEASGSALLVGHVERFNPAVAAVEKRVTDPRFIDCRRISGFPFRSAEVGVVLDLMIHDIDIVLHLCKSEVKSVEAVGVGVLSSAEDIANARMTFESGCVADVTASRVAMKTERRIRIFQPDSYISLDYEDRSAKMYTKKKGAEDIDISSLDPASVGDPMSFVFGKLICVDSIEVDESDPLEREIRSFVESVRTGAPTAVTGRHGTQAVQVAQKIREDLSK